jgi:hypothetical protein
MTQRLRSDSRLVNPESMGKDVSPRFPSTRTSGSLSTWEKEVRWLKLSADGAPLESKCICDVDSNWAIDGRRGGNGTQYVNHSCQPNSYVIVSEARIFIHALRESLPAKRLERIYLTNSTPSKQGVAAARPLTTEPTKPRGNCREIRKSVAPDRRPTLWTP